MSPNQKIIKLVCLPKCSEVYLFIANYIHARVSLCDETMKQDKTLIISAWAGFKTSPVLNHGRNYW